MSLDRIKTQDKTKNYDIKSLKAKSNTMVAKALEAMENYMDDENTPLKDKAQMGFKIVQNHIVLLDKEEKLEFIKLNKSNLVLRNNKLLQESLLDTEGKEYKKMVETDIEPKLDLGLHFLAQGDVSVS